MKIVLKCTLADIGTKVGVSAATVSMALRNNPRISLQTRTLVRKAAKSLGYRPDPLLSALVARRGRGQGARTFSNLAVLVDDRWELQGGAHEWLDPALEGMRSACLHLGYGMDVLYLEKDLGGLNKPDRLLYARGIRGLILPSLLEGHLKLKLDWDRYAVVTLGSPPSNLAFHRVGTDFYAGMGVVCTKLAKLGYRRVGLAHSYRMESSHRFEWLASLSKEIHVTPKRLDPVPPHLPVRFSKESYLRWIKKHKPECVISSEPKSYTYLKEAGIRVPEDIGVVSLATSRIPEMISGIAINYGLIGDICIMQLHGLLLRGESGVPSQQQETLICANWIDRNTVRKKTRAFPGHGEIQNRR
jgi:LacI family transcriptional regulator